jgi:hypothetical protein
MTDIAYSPKLMLVFCIFLTVLTVTIIAHDEALPWVYLQRSQPVTTTAFTPYDPGLPVSPARPEPGPTEPSLDLRPSRFVVATAAVRHLYPPIWFDQPD